MKVWHCTRTKLTSYHALHCFCFLLFLVSQSLWNFNYTKEKCKWISEYLLCQSSLRETSWIDIQPVGSMGYISNGIIVTLHPFRLWWKSSVLTSPLVSRQFHDNRSTLLKCEEQWPSAVRPRTHSYHLLTLYSSRATWQPSPFSQV